ncbi:MAG: radical SAM protein [Patescibacteria group bacterium]
MISYSLQRFWKYLLPIIKLTPRPVLKFIIEKFVKLQRQELIGELPSRIILFVTKKCNLRCRHCFYNRDSALEMSLQQIQQIALTNFKQIIFTGGEPFMRDDFSDIVLSFKNCEVINIDTNGTLTKKIEVFLDKILKETKFKLVIQVSLDGSPLIHNHIRNIEGSFKKTLQTIYILSQYKKMYPSRFNNIIVSTSINRLNYKHLGELIKYIEPLDVTHLFNFTRSAKLHTFNISRERLSGFDVLEDIVLNINEMVQVFKYLDTKLWKKNTDLLPIMNRQIMKEVIKILEQKSSPPCLAGQTEVVIYPEGDVGICEMLKPVGNLKETNYDFERFYKQHKEFKIKKSCTCIHDCNVMSQIKFSPKSLIEIVSNL